MNYYSIKNLNLLILFNLSLFFLIILSKELFLNPFILKYFLINFIIILVFTLLTSEINIIIWYFHSLNYLNLFLHFNFYLFNLIILANKLFPIIFILKYFLINLIIIFNSFILPITKIKNYSFKFYLN
jgi:hypothetical protein